MYRHISHHYQPINTITSFITQHHHYHTSIVLSINRIFLENDEIVSKNDNIFNFKLNKSDYRSHHLINALKLTKGEYFKAAIADKGISDSALISQCSTTDIDISIAENTLRPTAKPNIDLILAVPRPKKLAAILATVASIGVRRIFFIRADKVEAEYLGSHILAQPTLIRKHLITGLSQSSVDCHVPTVRVYKHMDAFFRDIPRLFPLPYYVRCLAHPLKLQIDEETLSKYGNRIRYCEMQRSKVGFSKRALSNSPPLDTPISEHISTSPTFSQLAPPSNWDGTIQTDRSLVLAIGPDGGWTDTELCQFVLQEFQCVNIGSRVLKTDIAIPALMCRASEWLHSCQFEQ